MENKNTLNNIDHKTMLRTDRVEIITYYLLIGGLALDHITTFMGLEYYNLYETNLIVRKLIEMGIWSYIDVFVCVSLIILLRLSLKRSNKYKEIIFLPFFSGIIRILVGISNLFIIYLI
jgi:hypothetical protein